MMDSYSDLDRSEYTGTLVSNKAPNPPKPRPESRNEKENKENVVPGKRSEVKKLKPAFDLIAKDLNKINLDVEIATGSLCTSTVKTNDKVDLSMASADPKKMS